MKVLVTEPLAEEGLALLREGAEVDMRLGLDAEQLAEVIGHYDALVVRSGTPVTASVIEAARRLKVIGRAGAGVDNIDLAAATRRGILVVNAPGSNSIAVAEHTLALMLALARRIPQADAKLRAGRWEKRSLAGVELRGKTLGIIGLGRVGTAVARRAAGLEMRLMAYDPFVAVDHAARLGVRLVSLDELLRTADFVSIHAPLTDLTRGMIGARELALMKPTAYLINCARGGIVDEEALARALAEGRLAGAALDVFAHEPPFDSPLLASEKVILTPHLGGSTQEAQRNVAVDVAQQVLAVLKGELPRYPVNAPALPPEELAELGPYIDLAERLGRFYAQLAGNNLVGVELVYAGEVAEHDTSLLKAAALVGLLSPISEEPVNLVNAELVAKGRGLVVEEHKSPVAEHFTGLISLRLSTTAGERLVSGTVMRGEPHIVRIDDFWLDFVAAGILLVSEHIEGPGILGRVGTLLGEAGVNISFVQTGRKGRGKRGVMVLGLDDPVTPQLLSEIMALPSIRAARVVKL